jgi:beta-mannosidase
MAAVFGEWRRRRSSCAGGLVWFLRDLWSGAGWGVVDATGSPKAAWWYLRRALAPVAVHISDEGVNGLAIHLVNDRPESLRPTLELGLFRGGEHAVGSAATTIELPAHGALELAAGELFDGFLDLAYAYRFGPPAHDLVVATLTVDGVLRGQAFHFPLGIPSASEAELGLTAEVDAQPDAGAATVVELVLRTRRFAQSVAIEIDGFLPDDSWFHLAPGGTRIVRLTPTGDARGPRGVRGWVRPLNADRATPIVTTSSASGDTGS